MAAQLETVLKKIEALKEQAKGQIATVIRELMIANDISIADLAGLNPKKVGRPKAAVRAKAAKPAKKATKPAAKAPKKAAATPAGKRKVSPLKGITHPPKYRHPDTGETWSGMARAPAWIKDVPDREVFRIAGTA